jgi:hypothetical protein
MPKARFFHHNKDTDCDGYRYDMNSLVIDTLPTYASSTVYKDYAIYQQFIQYLFDVQILSTERFHHDMAMEYYFQECIEGSKKIKDEFHLYRSIAKEYQHNNKTTVLTDNSLLRGVCITTKNIFSYISAKVTDSRENCKQRGKHTVQVESILCRYLPGLKRMFMYTCMYHSLDYNPLIWKRLKLDVLSKMKSEEIPESNSRFFPITRPVFTYLSMCYPHGKDNFPHLMLYVSLYFVGLRGACITSMTWRALEKHRIFLHSKSGEELQDVLLNIQNFKHHNKSYSYPYRLVRRLSIDMNHPQWI